MNRPFTLAPVRGKAGPPGLGTARKLRQPRQDMEDESMVGTIIGWFFLGLAVLLALVLAVPSAVYLRYRGGVFTLKVRVLFIVLTLLPAKPKKAKPPRAAREKKKKKAPAEDAKKDEKKAKKTLGQRLRAIRRLAAAGWAALARFLRHLRIKDVELTLPVHAAEAADTALRCGQAQAAIGLARALLDGRLRVRYKRLQVMPDFTGRQAGVLSFSCKAVFSLGIMFVLGWVFVKKYLAWGKRAYTRADYLRAARRRQAEEGRAEESRARAG